MNKNFRGLILKYHVGREVANQSWSESGLTASVSPLDDRRPKPPGIYAKDISGYRRPRLANASPSRRMLQTIKM